MTTEPPGPDEGALTPATAPTGTGPVSTGLIPGGRGGPEDELLEDGQEEVFSRTEVERGVIEHAFRTEGDIRET